MDIERIWAGVAAGMARVRGGGEEHWAMKRFFICEHTESPCIFTEASWLRLKEGNLDLKRCIRHGALISYEREAKDKAEVIKWARPNDR